MQRQKPTRIHIVYRVNVFVLMSVSVSVSVSLSSSVNTPLYDLI